jgi:outer membrane protein OmpA-like peptidoglycan-associated protein
MKKISIALILFIFFFVQANTVLADKDQLQFSIQKVKADIEKSQKKSEEVKVSINELQKAREYLKQAETELAKSKNWRGTLDKKAEPLITYYTEMAEIYTSIAFSRLEKVTQEKENTRLEKQIPEIEARIKVFDDKNAEIKKLKEILEKPQGKIRDVNSEITSLKKEKAELLGQVAQLKTEKEKFSGKIETLNEVVASVRIDLTEKIKAVENLSAENKLLKDNIKSSETSKGSSLIEMQTKLNAMDAKLKLFDTVGKIGFISKTSVDGYTFIVPRSKLVKTTAKNSVLTPDAEQYIAEIVESMKTLPESKLSIKVHGFGKPVNNEDSKSTLSMANLLKKAFLSKGMSESSIQASGAGTAAPLFSKSAIEENRCIEMTISNLSAGK